MGSFVVPAPTGGESLENYIEQRKPLIASRLINFIPTETSIELRKGFNSFFDLGSIKASNILDYEARKALIVIDNNKLYAIRNNILNEISYDAELGEVTSSLQTNDRLLVFFVNRAPLVIFYSQQSDEWQTEELELTPVTVPEPLSGAIVYNARVFFYVTGNNIIYYLDPLTYKGATKAYDLSQRFNVRGNLVFLGTIGYNAGASVQKLMYAVFDSGDILTFSGTNPDDLTSWVVEQKVETGVKIYASITAFTDSLLLSKDSLYSLTEILKNNTASGSDTLTGKIKARIQEIQSSGILKLCFLSGFLYLIHLDNTNHFGINISTGAIFELDNLEISDFTVLDNELIFINKAGVIFKAFNGTSDAGSEILGTWESFPITMPDYSKFRTVSSYIDCYVEGDYKLTYYQRVDDAISFLKRSDILIDDGEIRWDVLDGKSWEWVEANLWAGVGIIKKHIFKISSGSNCNRYAFKLEVRSNLNNGFNFNSIVINYI